MLVQVNKVLALHLFELFLTGELLRQGRQLIVGFSHVSATVNRLESCLWVAHVHQLPLQVSLWHLLMSSDVGLRGYNPIFPFLRFAVNGNTTLLAGHSLGRTLGLHDGTWKDPCLVHALARHQAWRRAASDVSRRIHVRLRPRHHR